MISEEKTITTVPQAGKKTIHKRTQSIQLPKTKDFDEQNIEELLAKDNTDNIESLYSGKELLELKKKLIIYRIKKMRNDSALKIQKMWNRYLIRLQAHKIAHKVRACYTISPEKRNVCHIYIKIYTSDFNEDEYKIKKLKFCPIRKAFVLDIPKTKFYNSKKVINFNFIKNNEIFFDNAYKKVLYANKTYVHQIDFSLYDKGQKFLDENVYNSKQLFPEHQKFNISKANDSNNYLSTEDDSENLRLTPTIKGNTNIFAFSEPQIKKFEENYDNEEYDGLRVKKRKGSDNNRNGDEINSLNYKRFESFDVTSLYKSTLKSILKESNKELWLCKKRSKMLRKERKVSFGETSYFN